MYESRHEPPQPSHQFALRLLGHLAVALLLLAFSLGLGIAGYMGFEDLPFLDALLNSAMLLGGMGPVNPPLSAAGKVFASAYALYAGLVFIVTAALLFTPLVHRVLHRFQWDEPGD
jgi:hypothetical protein